MSSCDETMYEDIRPYRDHEFKAVMGKLLDSPLADVLLSAVFPGIPLEMVKNELRTIETINEFQGKIIYRVIRHIIDKTSAGFTTSGLENLDKSGNYLFISNHRDILLDPSLLNFAIYANGMETAEIAIGDNLMQTLWVKDLSRLNKSFVVKRNLPVRELVVASRHLSCYIHDTIFKNHHSVWIAQREGRAKDGNDRTQPGVLNMIGLASDGDLKAYFTKLNIIPLSVSYEYDPCDIDKARSIYAIKFFGGYTKEKNEDNLAMKKGIQGYKGRIHLHFGNLLNERISEIPDGLHKNELISRISGMIDKEIIGNYELHKTNRIAWDILNHSDDNAGYYTDDEKTAFIQEIEKKVSTMAGETDELKTIFLEMYARPYQNKIELSGKI